MFSHMRYLLPFVLVLCLGCGITLATRVLFSVPINLGAEHQFDLAIHDSDVDAASSEAGAAPGLARVAARFCSDRGVAAGVPVSACESALVSGLRREWSKYLTMKGRAQAPQQALSQASSHSSDSLSGASGSTGKHATAPAAASRTDTGTEVDTHAERELQQLGWRRAMDPSSGEYYFVHGRSGRTSDLSARLLLKQIRGSSDDASQAPNPVQYNVEAVATTADAATARVSAPLPASASQQYQNQHLPPPPVSPSPALTSPVRLASGSGTAHGVDDGSRDHLGLANAGDSYILRLSTNGTDVHDDELHGMLLFELPLTLHGMSLPLLFRHGDDAAAKARSWCTEHGSGKLGPQDVEAIVSEARRQMARFTEAAAPLVLPTSDAAGLLPGPAAVATALVERNNRRAFGNMLASRDADAALATFLPEGQWLFDVKFAVGQGSDMRVNVLAGKSPRALARSWCEARNLSLPHEAPLVAAMILRHYHDVWVWEQSYNDEVARVLLLAFVLLLLYRVLPLLLTLLRATGALVTSRLEHYGLRRGYERISPRSRRNAEIVASASKAELDRAAKREARAQEAREKGREEARRRQARLRRAQG